MIKISFRKDNDDRYVRQQYHVSFCRLTRNENHVDWL